MPQNIDNYCHGAVEVSDEATQVLTGDVSDNVSLILQNDGESDILLGRNSSVSAENAFYRLVAGESAEDNYYHSNLWVVTESGTTTLRFESTPKRAAR